MLLNLLVLRCRNIKTTKTFYEALGFDFVQEQHCTSPIHYSARIGAMLLELYPTKGEPDNVRLGFVVAPTILEQLGINGHGVLRDPDGRGVELTEIQ